MRVALELQPCCWVRSGIGTFTYEIAKRLTDTETVTYHGNVFNFLKRNSGASLSGIEMPITENFLLPYGLCRRAWNYIPIPYRLFFPRKADLTFFFNYIVPPNIDGRVVTTVHDLTFLRCPETMKRSNYVHLEKGLRYSVDRSDKILTVSEFSKREICTLLAVPQEKVEVVYSAPSLADEKEDFEKVKKQFNISEDYILFVGTIEPRKNISRLLRAFEYLKINVAIPHKLVLAGGKGWNDEEIYLTLQDLQCQDDVILTGYIPASVKNSLYQHASLFVFPSIYEGFGIPPLEAMTFGCPVVCSNAASLPEVVGSAACLVDPLDMQSIANGIYSVLYDPDYKENLVEKGYSQAERFSWKNTVGGLEKVIAEFL